MNNQINKKKSEIKKTLIPEKKNSKIIHTFNVKSNRQNLFQFQKMITGKQKTNNLNKSFFNKNLNMSKRKSFFESSKLSPLITFNSSNQQNIIGIKGID